MPTNGAKNSRTRALTHLGFWFLMQARFDLFGSGGGVAYLATHVRGFIFGLFMAYGFRFMRFGETSFGPSSDPGSLARRLRRAGGL